MRMQHAVFPFRSAREQIDQVQKWNQELRWGFTESEFIEAERSVPEWPSETLSAPILVPYLPSHNRIPGFVRTFHTLWKLATKSQPHSWLDETVAFAGGGDVLSLYDTDNVAPGLRWEVIQFGAGRGERVKDILAQGPRPWPHAGVLAAAAHNPEWVRTMNGRDVPYVYLPGYLVRMHSVDQRSRRTIARPGMMLLSYADHLRIDVIPLHFKGNERRAIPALVEVIYAVT